MTDKYTPPSEVQVEGMVRRRVADALASAGVSPGVISREVIFMLPTEFVKTYVTIFDKALIENISASGMGAQGDKANPVRRVVRTGALRDKGKGRRGSKDSRRAVVQVGAGGGKRRYKDYWVIKDERAFEVKRQLDRRLRRLAAQAMRELTSRSARESAEIMEVRCSQCHADLTTLREMLGNALRHCPQCGISVPEIKADRGMADPEQPKSNS